MVTGRQQVVDIGIDPLDERRRRRRSLARIGVPVGGVALMVATILAIAVYSDRANRAGALASARVRGPSGGLVTVRLPRGHPR